MGDEVITENDAMVRGQVKLLKHLYNFLDAAAIRCALQLHLADIINSHHGPISLSEIVANISSPSLDVDGLSRLIRFLVYKQLFNEELHQPEGSTGEEIRRYSLNHSSKWLLHDSNDSLSAAVMMATDPIMVSPLFNLHRSIITEGCTAMKVTHGHHLWDLTALKTEFNHVFSEGMACTTRTVMNAIMSSYKFDWLKGTLVDVAGGLGMAINEIVSSYPEIKGINFDLPHVIAIAPVYDGVTNVGGDMFEQVPPADSVLLKSILHNWNDKKCIRILQNCRKAISERTGKVIIVDSVLYSGSTDHMYSDIRMTLDLLMLAYTPAGRERTETEWKMLLKEAGFSRYNIIQIPAAESIIEAYID